MNVSHAVQWEQPFGARSSSQASWRRWTLRPPECVDVLPLIVATSVHGGASHINTEPGGRGRIGAYFYLWESRYCTYVPLQGSRNGQWWSQTEASTRRMDEADCGLTESESSALKPDSWRHHESHSLTRTHITSADWLLKQEFRFLTAQSQYNMSAPPDALKDSLGRFPEVLWQLKLIFSNFVPNFTHHATSTTLSQDKSENWP